MEVVFDLQSVVIDVQPFEHKELKLGKIPNSINFAILEKISTAIREKYTFIEGWEVLETLDNEKEPSVGDSVIVKDPEDGDDIWSHSFSGTITDIIAQPENKLLYIIEDQDGDFFEMERNKFELG